MATSNRTAIGLIIETGTSGPDETLELGTELAAVLRHGDMLVLTGDLGAGKTKLVQGIGNGLGVDEPITSPTFALANRYETERTDGSYLHHLDVYRLNVVGEAADLDLPDLLDSGITAIEWGEQIEAVLPADYLLVAIEYVDDGDEDSDNRRIIRFHGAGEKWSSRVEELTSVLATWSTEPAPEDGQDRAS